MLFFPAQDSDLSTQLLSLPCLRIYTPQKGSHWLAPANLLYLEGEVTYTWFYLTDGQRLLIPYTLKRFEAQLPSPCFIRLHRRYLVNRLVIKQIQLDKKGGFVSLKTGQKLPISRRRAALLRQELGLSGWSADKRVGTQTAPL